MERLLFGLVTLMTLGVGACGNGAEPNTDGTASGGKGSESPSSSGDGDGEEGAGGKGSGEGGDADRGENDDGPNPDKVTGYGIFGKAETTFTLPEMTGDLPRLAYEDVQTAFPEVDWDRLDRLYIPANHYGSVLLGNLPVRSAERRLVITNQGGQVRIGSGGFGYNLNLRGGTNWTLTGRYDPECKTGDEAFRGHLEGDYAHSQGTYGFLIDDEFSKEGLSGVFVGGGASDFEIDSIEITRAEFAGISAKTDDDGDATMKNVHLHDTYIHDVGSEGIYFGSTQAQPQHSFENLQIHDNRFLRTGTEALQVGQLGDGCEIHHNAIGPAAIRWRSAFSNYQNGNVQYGQRYGSSSFHHNIVIGAGDLFVEFFPQPVAGDPHGNDDTVTFTDNYFADTSSTGVYTHADENDVSVIFQRNSFRGFNYNYIEVYPDANEPGAVFGVGSNTKNPHLLQNNDYEAPFPFIQWVFDSVTEQENTEGEVPRARFVDFMGDALDENYRNLEWWTATATLHPEKVPVVYSVGFYVMHQGTLYRARTENQGKVPPDSPNDWEALPAPADDVRLATGSAYAGYGVR